MTYFHIKLLAALFMVVDHVGVVFFPDESMFRVIGRFSFPLFAWLLVQGERYTRDIYRYLGRLAIFALISQPFYSWLFNVTQLNVLVTLGVGLTAVRLGKVFPEFRYLWWAVGIVVSGLIPMDAGAYGVCVILLMAEWRADLPPPRAIRWWLLWLGLHALYVVAALGSTLQLWAIATPLLLYVTGTERGPKARWFYGFYPGHLAVLLLLSSNGLILDRLKFLSDRAHP